MLYYRIPGVLVCIFCSSYTAFGSAEQTGWNAEQKGGYTQSQYPYRVSQYRNRDYYDDRGYDREYYRDRRRRRQNQRVESVKGALKQNGQEISILGDKLVIPDNSAAAISRTLADYYSARKSCIKFAAGRGNRNVIIHRERSRRFSPYSRRRPDPRVYFIGTLEELGFIRSRPDDFASGPRQRGRWSYTEYDITRKGKRHIKLINKGFHLCYAAQKFHKLVSVSPVFTVEDISKNRPVGEVSGPDGTAFIYDYNKNTLYKWRCKRNARGKCDAIRVKYKFRVIDIEPWANRLPMSLKFFMQKRDPLNRMAQRFKGFGETTATRIYGSIFAPDVYQNNISADLLNPEVTADIEFIRTPDGWVTKNHVGKDVISPR